MISIQFQAIANHLWQSTLFAAAAGLLVIAFRRYGPQARYGLWLAASAKFLVPFSFFSAAGSWFGRRAELPIVPPISFAIKQVNEPFTVDLLSQPSFGKPRNTSHRMGVDSDLGDLGVWLALRRHSLGKRNAPDQDGPARSIAT